MKFPKSIANLSVMAKARITPNRSNGSALNTDP
jgi:hypothetical protein